MIKLSVFINRSKLAFNQVVSEKMPWKCKFNPLDNSDNNNRFVCGARMHSMLWIIVKYFPFVLINSTIYGDHD